MYHRHCFNVKIGPGLPILPTGIDAINITAYSATIVWQVPSLAYSQERYNVSYGRTRSPLTNSLIITGTTVDRATSNMTYDTIISNLIPNTMYYYQLSSMNSQGMVTSNVMEFMTSEAGKKHLWIAFLHYLGTICVI